MRDVSILISNYNSFDAIQLCVESILAYTDYPRYKIVVHDDESPNGIDIPYLEEAEARGWLRLIKGTNKACWRAIGGTYPQDIHHAPFWHGYALNTLINDVCDTELAVTMDCDVFVREPDWLQCLVDMVDEKTLIVSDEGPLHQGLSGLWVMGWFMLNFASINMTAYRNGMIVDWLPDTAHLMGRRFIWDPGAALWMKMRLDNPRGYVSKTIPSRIEAKRWHATQVSVRMDGPGRNPRAIAGDEYFDRHYAPITRALEELRGR